MTVTDMLQASEGAHPARSRKHGPLTVLQRLGRRLSGRHAILSARPLAAFEAGLSRIEACAAHPEGAAELPDWPPMSLIEHIHASPARGRARAAESYAQAPAAARAALEEIVAEMNVALLAGIDELRSAAGLGDAAGAGTLAQALAGYLRGLLAQARAIMDDDMPAAP